MRRPEELRTGPGNLWYRQTTRREVLRRGLYLAGGLAVAPSLVAACATSSVASSAAPASAGRLRVPIGGHEQPRNVLREAGRAAQAFGIH